MSFTGPDFSTSLHQKPARMSLANIATGQEIEAQFNPSELKEKIAATYSRLGVLGMSHKPLQYQQTENHGFSFELALRVFDGEGNQAVAMAQKRRFILSLFYSSRGAGDIIGGAPPDVLFVWPNLASMVSKVMSAEITHTLFGRDGTPYHMGIKLELEDMRDVRLFSEDVLANGTLR